MLFLLGLNRTVRPMRDTRSAHKSTITLLSVFFTWCDHEKSLKNIFYPLYQLPETVFRSEVGRILAMLLNIHNVNICETRLYFEFNATNRMPGKNFVGGEI